MVQVAGEMVQRKKGTHAVDQDALHAALDDNHERLGAAVLDKLGYPEAFAALVKQHHRTGAPESTPNALRLLQQADLLARAAGFGLGRDTPESIAMLREELDISEQTLQATAPEIVQRMEQLRYVFG